jgi:hypothetical protein
MESVAGVNSPMNTDQWSTNTKNYDAYNENRNITMYHHVVCFIEM